MERRIPRHFHDHRRKSLGVVMSRNAGFSDQVWLPNNLWIVGLNFCYFPFLYSLLLCLLKILSWVLLVMYGINQSFKVVELDFLYPSEGIHRRWESGYRITCMAATADQAAFILSIPKRKLMDETQETLRTSAFPSTHVKVQTHLRNEIHPTPRRFIVGLGR